MVDYIGVLLMSRAWGEKSPKLKCPCRSATCALFVYRPIPKTTLPGAGRDVSMGASQGLPGGALTALSSGTFQASRSRRANDMKSWTSVDPSRRPGLGVAPGLAPREAWRDLREPVPVTATHAETGTPMGRPNGLSCGQKGRVEEGKLCTTQVTEQSRNVL